MASSSVENTINRVFTECEPETFGKFCDLLIRKMTLLPLPYSDESYEDNIDDFINRLENLKILLQTKYDEDWFNQQTLKRLIAEFELNEKEQTRLDGVNESLKEKIKFLRKVLSIQHECEKLVIH
jgi:hypothetical protein